MIRTFAAFCVAAVFAMPSLALAEPCPRTKEKPGYVTVCRTTTLGGLNVRKEDNADSRALCDLGKQKFWAEKGMGTQDRRRWYKIRFFDPAYNGWASELSGGKLTTKAATGCRPDAPRYRHRRRNVPVS